MKIMKSYVAHCQSGYYGYDRTVVVDKKLRDHEYAQCGINGHGTFVQFVSYETIVCEIDNGWLHCYGTFFRNDRKANRLVHAADETGIWFPD